MAKGEFDHEHLATYNDTGLSGRPPPSRLRNSLDKMTHLDFVMLSLIFFVTSIVSVVTGATWLITVPVLLAFGMPTVTAIGTNMLALAALSLGATLSFRHGDVINRERLPPLLTLTIIGSIIGAMLVFAVPEHVLLLTIAGAMLAVALVVLRPARVLLAAADPPWTDRPPFAALGYGLTLLLGIYGGFFSGGYVTLLTAVFVICFRTSFLRAVATTETINLASSFAATLILLGEGPWTGRLESYSVS